MKTTSHSLMAKGIMVLLSLLILVFVFTYSWFIDPERPVTASGLYMQTSSTLDFDMAIGFVTEETGHYVVTDFTGGDSKAIDFSELTVHNTLTLPSSDQSHQNYSGTPGDYHSFNLFEEFNPVDLTGNGATLVRPFMEFKNTGIKTSEYRVMHNYDQLKAEYQNKYYISFDLYVRSNVNDYKISVVNGSYVISAAETYWDVDEYDDRVILEGDALDDAVLNKTYHSRINASNIDATLLNTAPIARRSTYGAFSEDSVVGAIRVGVTKYSLGEGEDIDDVTTSQFFDGNDTHIDSDPALLWIPRSDIYLQNVYDPIYNNDDPPTVTGYAESATGWVLYDKNDGVWDDATFNPAYVDNVSTGKSYKEAASEHTYYDWAKMAKYQEDNDAELPVAQRYTTVDYAVTDLSAPGSQKVVIEPIYEAGGFYYGKCHINLWIEGCDAEARRAIDGGKFFFGFMLESVSI